MRSLLLLIAAVVAIIAGLAALQLSNKPVPVIASVQHQTVTTVNILVAKAPLAPGTIITEAMIEVQPWPDNLVPKNFIVQGAENANIVGKVTRSPFQEKEPFISNKLAGIDEPGFLAANLPAGTRAVTIATDAVAGIAGFVFPGDRVDVILTHNIPFELKASDKKSDNHMSVDRPAFSEVVLANAPVLAVNLRNTSTRDDTQSQNVSISPSSITLQVGTMDVQHIRLAEKNGTLSFALRSINDMHNDTVADPTDLPNLTRAELPKAAEAEDTVKITKR